jgi:serine protease Do
MDSRRSRRFFPGTLAPAWAACVAAAFVAAFSPAAFASEMRRTAVVKAVEQARPSVVNIQGQKTLAANDAQLAGGDSSRRVNGMGTGVVIDERGYILTNLHVVEGVRHIQVTLADRRSYIATLVVGDAKTDLAIIKIPVTEPLPVINIGGSHDLMTGEPVIAVGNAFGYEHTVTRGIISALHRSVQISDTQKYDDLIQTDASINPGNSGGPLLNIDGEMIALNVAVRIGAQGIGFAIPVDQVMEIAARMLAAERLSNVRHGVTGETRVAEESRSFVVAAVAENSPAAKGGLKEGDILSTIGKTKIERALDLERAFLNRTDGEEIPVTVTRDGQPLTLNFVIHSDSSSSLAATDRTWTVLGLRLEPVPTAEFARLSSRYRGGLRVTAVRPESPAATRGILRGDIVVGMHIWETTSLDNVTYILGRGDFDQFEPLKFYILRGQETLYGHLPVSHRR